MAVNNYTPTELQFHIYDVAEMFEIGLQAAYMKEQEAFTLSAFSWTLIPCWSIVNEGWL